MTCPSCHDRGVFRIAYRDGSPAEFAICLCGSGAPFRVTDNNGKAHVPHYQVWAIRSGLDPQHVAPMEELLTDEEMAARGFADLPTPPDAREAALLNAGKRKR